MTSSISCRWLKIDPQKGAIANAAIPIRLNRHVLGQVARKIIYEAPNGGQQSSAVREQSGEGGFIREPVRQNPCQFPTAQLGFANVCRQGDNSHSLDGCALESGHVVT